ncbi:MAG: NUDIX domain-containing protein [Candidatus Methylacidiphilales bacterium]|nr:NUDIX domain-containing protein [Candidatus Methylacidiphilales bacterium]
MAVIKNVILDWSGTLVNDFLPVVQATNDIFVRYGKPPMTPDEFRQRFRLPFVDFYREYLPEATMVELEHHYHSSFKLLQTDIDMLPDAREFLEYCHEREMPMFLLSTIHHEHYEVQAERLGIKHYFKKAYVEAFDKRKTILHLLAEHDLEPQETIFIGDMVHDIDTAHHGGVVSCGVLTGYDPLEKLKTANPELLFRSLSHVSSHFERHRQEPEAKPIATVGALIYNEAGEVLMVRTHKWSGLWGIPGGKIQAKETSEAALRRETLEETGLELKDIRFAMVQDCILPPEFYKKAHFLLLNYTATATSTNVVLNDEAEEHRWLLLEEAEKLQLNTPTRTLVDYVRSHSH